MTEFALHAAEPDAAIDYWVGAAANSTPYTGPFTITTPGPVRLRAVVRDSEPIDELVVLLFLQVREVEASTAVCAAPALKSDDLHASMLPSHSGLYRVQLSAFDGCQTYVDSVLVDVQCNGPPTAAAGADRVVVWNPAQAAFDAAELVGAGSAPQQDGDMPVGARAGAPVRFSWMILRAPADSLLALPASASTLSTSSRITFTPDKPGDYLLQLTVDTGCAESTDTLRVTATCGAPLVARVDTELPTLPENSDVFAAAVRERVNVSAIASTIVDGGTSFFWEFIALPDASRGRREWRFEAVDGAPTNLRLRGNYTLPGDGNPNAAYSPSTFFTPDVEGDFRLRLTITDGCQISTTTITIRALCADPPRPSAGAARVIRVGNRIDSPRRTPLRVDLLGSVGDAPWESLLWSFDSQPVGLIAVDDDDANRTDVDWTTQDDGAFSEKSALDFPDDDEHPRVRAQCPGSVLNSVCRTSRAILRNPTSLTTAYFIPDAVGTYVARLTVNGACATRSNTTVIQVECNAPPVADAGGDRVVPRGMANAFEPVRLDGSNSQDPDPDDTDLLYRWEIITRPATSQVLLGRSALTGAEAAVASFLPDANGEYVVRLTVSDYCSSSSTTVRVTVGCNRPPKAAANGATQRVAFRNGTFAPLVLDGSYSYDPDGDSDIVSYTWRLTRIQTPIVDFDRAVTPADDFSDVFTPIPAAPGAVLFDVPNTVIEALSDLGTGEVPTFYTLELRVEDGCSASTTEVVVEASCPGAPYAYTGPTQELVWNTRRGSRFATPGQYPAGENEGVACAGNLEGGCLTKLQLAGFVEHAPSGATTSWQWVSTPSTHSLNTTEFMLTPTALTNNVTFALSAYNNTRPFRPEGLGVQYAGDYLAQVVVKDDCVSSGATQTLSLRCNDAPVAVARTRDNLQSKTILFILREALFPFVELTAEGTHPSYLRSSTELTLDSRTWRYEWTMAFESTGRFESNVPSLVAAPNEPLPTFTGVEALSGLHQVFVTSTTYDGNLGGVAGADAKCAARAAAGGHPFPEDFRAVICMPRTGESLVGTAGQNRFATEDNPVYTTASVHGGFRDVESIGSAFKVSCGAECVVRFNSMNVLSGVAHDEFGVFGFSASVYAGCYLNGTAIVGAGPTELCNGWTSSSSSLSHRTGNAAARSPQRFDNQSPSCATQNRLMCLRTRARTPTELGIHAGPFQTYAPTFLPSKLGHYDITLHVTDGCQAANSTVRITAVCPTPPNMNAGPDLQSVWSRRVMPGAFSLVTADPNQPEGFLFSWEQTAYLPADPNSASEWFEREASDQFPFPSTSGDLYTFHPAILGASEPNLTKTGTPNPSVQPGNIGVTTLEVVTNDGCSIIRDALNITAVCNTPPRLNSSFSFAGTSRWDGEAFPLLMLNTSGVDADGDIITFDVHTVRSHEPPSEPLPGTEAAVLGDDASNLVAPRDATGTIKPLKLGSWEFEVSATDGCTIVRTNLRVESVCSDRPVAAAAGVALEGGFAVYAPWSGRTSRFVDTELDASPSTDADADRLRFHWELLSLDADARVIVLQNGSTSETLNSLLDDTEFVANATTADEDVMTDLYGSETAMAIQANGSTTEYASFSLGPEVLGQSLWRLNVSDGCLRDSVLVQFIAACNEPPVPRAHTASGGTVFLWTNGSRFGDVTLSASQSTDANGDSLSARWFLRSYAPPSPPTAYFAHDRSVLPLAANGTGGPVGADPLADDETLANSDYSRLVLANPQPSDPMAFTWTAELLGTYVFRVAVDDGCSRRSETLTIAVECDAPARATFPAADANGVITVVWGGAGVGFDSVDVVVEGEDDNQAVSSLEYSWLVDSFDPFLVDANTTDDFVPAVVGAVSEPDLETNVDTLTRSAASTTLQYTPSKLGTMRLDAFVFDGCSITRKRVEVKTVCGDAPTVTLSGLDPSTGGLISTVESTNNEFRSITVLADIRGGVRGAATPYVEPTFSVVRVGDDNPETPEFIISSCDGDQVATPLGQNTSCTITPTTPGTYIVNFVVHDGCRIVRESLTFEVACNDPPLTSVAPGRDSQWTGSSFADIVLDASESADPEMDALAFHWTFADDLFEPYHGANYPGSTFDEVPEDFRFGLEPAVQTTATSAQLVGSLLGGNTQNATLRPTALGRFRLKVEVSDGCSVSSLFLTSNVTCPTAPTLNIVGAPTLVSVWSPVDREFAPVLLNASGNEGAGSPVFRWQSLRFDRSAGPSNVLPSVVAVEGAAEDEGIGVVNATGEMISLSPGVLGTTTIRATVSDGCSFVSRDIRVTAECGVTPTALASSGATIVEGQPTLVSVWNGTDFRDRELGSSEPALVTVAEASVDFEWDVVEFNATSNAAGLFVPEVVSPQDRSTLSSASVKRPTFTPVTLGSWLLRQRASDGCTTSTDDVVVVSECNNAPVVGSLVAPNVTVVFANASDPIGTRGEIPVIELEASVTDSESDPINVRWTLSQFTPVSTYSGPVNAAIETLYVDPDTPITATVNVSVSALNPTFEAPHLGTYEFDLAVDDGCRVVHARTSATVACPAPSIDLEDIPDLVFIKYVGDSTVEGGAVRRNATLTAVVSGRDGVPVSPVLGESWEFLGWRQVGYTCPDNTVGFAEPGSVFGTDATNTPTEDGGQCLTNNAPADPSGEVATTLDFHGVGEYVFEAFAFDGCTILRKIARVAVLCNPTPAARVALVPNGLEAPSPVDSFASSVEAPATLARYASLGGGLVFPEVLLNASLSFDEPDPEDKPLQVLRYIWTVVSAPRGSTVGRMSRADGLQHPNATSNVLFGAAVSSATQTYGEVGMGAGLPFAVLAAYNGSVEGHQRAGAVNPEAYVAFRPDRVGQYRLRLTVHDGCSESAADVVVEAVCNNPPVANAGADFAVTTLDAVSGRGRGGSNEAESQGSADAAVLRSRVSLSGAQTTDPDHLTQGDELRDPIFFEWSVVRVPDGSITGRTLHGASTAHPFFVPDVPGAYTFRLSASNMPLGPLGLPPSEGEEDDDGATLRCATSEDEVTVTVSCGQSPQPVAVASSSSRWGVYPDPLNPVHAPRPRFGPVTLLGGNTTDPDSSTAGLEFQWTIQSAPLGSRSALITSPASVLAATLWPDTPGAFEVSLEASDGCTSGRTSTGVTVACNEAPEAVVDESSITFVLEHVYEAVSGVVNRPDAVIFRRSDSGELIPATVSGGDIAIPDLLAPRDTITAGATALGGMERLGVLLNGSRSRDVSETEWGTDGDFLTFQWSLAEAPSASVRASLRNADRAVASFVPDVLGRYRARLTVSDGCQTADALVTVDVACSATPAVSAGLAQELFWRADVNAANVGEFGSVEELEDGSAVADSAGVVVVLDGTVADPDDDEVGVRWEIVSSPYASDFGTAGQNNGRLRIAEPTQRVTYFVADVPGSYAARLTVTDGCTSASSIVHIHVLCAAPLNNPVSASPADVVSSVVGAWVDFAGAFDFAAFFARAPNATLGDDGRRPVLPDVQFSWSVSEAEPVLRTGERYVVPLHVEMEMSAVEIVSATGLALTPTEITELGLTGVRWTLTAEPAGAATTLVNPTQLRLRFTPRVNGEYRFHLSLQLGCHSLSGTAVVVAICDDRPKARAGVDQVVELEPATMTIVHLNGTGSGDDSTASAALGYAWRFVGAPSVRRPGSSVATAAALVAPVPSAAILVDASTSTPHFVADGVGTFALELVASDGCKSDAATTLVSVVCARAPVLSAGGVQGFWSEVVPEPAGGDGEAMPRYEPQSTLLLLPRDAEGHAFVTLSMSVDALAGAGEVRFRQWRWVSVPEDSVHAGHAGTVFSTLAAVNVSLDAAGAYVYEAAVSDGCYVTTATGSVIVGADVPLVSAGQRYDMTLPRPEANLFVLDRTRYIDGRGVVVATRAMTGPVDGLEVTWTLVSKPALSTATVATLLSPSNVLAPAFVPDVPGTYRLRLSVRDGTRTALSGADSVSDEVIVVVECGAAPAVVVDPVVHVAVVGEAVSISARNSTDADGSAEQLSFEWSFVSTPLIQPIGDSVASAAVGAPLAPSGLRSSDLVGRLSSEVRFAPDGLGLYSLAVRASDSCSSRSATALVQAVCRPGLVAQVVAASELMTTSFPIPLQFLGSASWAPGFEPEDASSTFAFAWEWVSVPANASDALIVGRTVSTAPELSIDVNTEGAYGVRLRVSDGCSVADTVVLLHVVYVPPEPSPCPSFSSSPSPTPTSSTTPSPTPTPSPSMTSSPTPTASPTPTSSTSATPTSSTTPSSTPSTTPSMTPSATPTPSTTTSATPSTAPSIVPTASPKGDAVACGVAEETVVSTVTFSVSLAGVLPSEFQGDVRAAWLRVTAAQAGVPVESIVIRTVGAATRRREATAAVRELQAGLRIDFEVRVDSSTTGLPSAEVVKSTLQTAIESGSLAANLNADATMQANAIQTSVALEALPVVESTRTVVIVTENDEAVVSRTLFIAVLAVAIGLGTILVCALLSWWVRRCRAYCEARRLRDIDEIKRRNLAVRSATTPQRTGRRVPSPTAGGRAGARGGGGPAEDGGFDGVAQGGSDGAHVTNARTLRNLARTANAVRLIAQTGASGRARLAAAGPSGRGGFPSPQGPAAAGSELPRSPSGRPLAPVSPAAFVDVGFGGQETDATERLVRTPASASFRVSPTADSLARSPSMRGPVTPPASAPLAGVSPSTNATTSSSSAASSGLMRGMSSRADTIRSASPAGRAGFLPPGPPLPPGITPAAARPSPSVQLGPSADMTRPRPLLASGRVPSMNTSRRDIALPQQRFLGR